MTSLKDRSHACRHDGIGLAEGHIEVEQALVRNAPVTTALRGRPFRVKS
jgi:hypothetical protein